ncbi:hypothetical protein D3C85_1766220 [compost metagenome]
MKRPKPQPPVVAYFRESLTMICTVVALPGMDAEAKSGEGTSFHASFTSTLPSGKGSVPLR